jgi:hypothetical protein
MWLHAGFKSGWLINRSRSRSKESKTHELLGHSTDEDACRDVFEDRDKTRITRVVDLPFCFKLSLFFLSA